MRSIYLLKSIVETQKTYFYSAVFALGTLFVVSLFANQTLLYYVAGILLVMPVIAPSVAKWRVKKRILPERKAVFISGCDTGFGYMLAQRLDDMGFHVFAGCLFPDGDGATNLRNSGSNRLHVIELDVTSDSSVQQAVDYVNGNLDDNILWAIVNNAGINEVGELSWMSMEVMRRIVDVNTFGVIRMTKAFLPKLKESKGRVVTIASMAGRYTIPEIVPYCMSKAATISFCDGLRLEMYKWNIPVIVIEPTFYRTGMTNEETNRKVSRQRWESVPKEVKDMHGSNYNLTASAKFCRYQRYISRSPNEVVSVMEDAITALYPEYYYTPGSLIIRVLVWISIIIPKPIADMFIFYVFRQEHQMKFAEM